MAEPEEILVLATELNTLRTFQRNTMTTMRSLFGDDDAGFRRLASVLHGTMADNGASIDLQFALDQALIERDRARKAIKRLEDHGDYYAASIVRGDV